MLTKVLPLATLFLSLSTLICCALPAIFVVLGAGATFVSLLGVFPQLIWFSEHKVPVFAVALALLIVTAVMRASIPRQCPTNPALAEQCAKARKVSGVIYLVSIGAFCVGGFFAFVAPLLY